MSMATSIPVRRNHDLLRGHRFHFSVPFLIARKLHDDNDSSYLRRRLEQLAEDASPSKDDPLAGPSDALATLSAVEKKSHKPNDDNQARLISATSSKFISIAGRHAKETAMDEPWTGVEKTSDSVLRMLVDKHKKPKGTGVKFRPPDPTAGMGPRHRNKIASARIADAREDVLDYTLAKKSSNVATKTDAEQEEFRSLYSERFLSPSSVGSGIKALADRRIEEARARGAFKNISRGKPLETDQYNRSPYVETTEFLLNRMLQSQRMNPPWIEKQIQVRSEIDHFRRSLRDRWLSHAVRLILTNEKCIDRQIASAEHYANAEKQNDVYAKLRDPVWENTERAYHKKAIEMINSSIRSYNLQAPSPSRWNILTLEKELTSCFQGSADDLVSIVRARTRQTANGSMRSSFFGDGEKDAGQTSLFKHDQPSQEIKGREYGLKQLFRDILSSWRGA